MDSNVVEVLYNIYHRKLSKVSVEYKRYLYENINWTSRLIGIKGSRGVGKTTLLLQYIKCTFADVDNAFYISLDDLWFKTQIFDFENQDGEGTGTFGKRKIFCDYGC